MEVTRTHLLAASGLLLVALGAVGLWDAAFVHPTCRHILSDVRVCETDVSRAIPSALAGLVGAALLLVARRRRASAPSRTNS